MLGFLIILENIDIFKCKRRTNYNSIAKKDLHIYSVIKDNVKVL